MNDFLHADNVEPIGWMLVHSLWLLLIPAALLAIVLLMAPSSWSRFRYTTGLLALCAMAAAPMVALKWVAPKASAHSAADAGSVENRVSTVDGPNEKVSPVESERLVTDPNGSPDLLSQETQSNPSAVVMESEALAAVEFVDDSGEKFDDAETESNETAMASSELSDRIRPWLPTLVACWLIGVLLMTVQLLLGWWGTRRLRQVGVSAVSDRVRSLFEELRTTIGTTRAVKIVQSTLVTVPSVVGHFRPIVLLPLSAVTGLSEEQLRAILAHELAHVKRCDYAVNIVQSVIETVLFYHPAVWWVSRIVRAERENCCDDIALTARCQPVDLANALVKVNAAVGTNRSMVTPAADGGDLLKRIRRLAGPARKDPSSRKSWLAGVLVLATLLAVSATSMFPASDAAADDVAQTSESNESTGREPDEADDADDADAAGVAKDDKLRAAGKGLGVIGGSDRTEPPKSTAKAPTSVPWPVEKFPSFADYPSSGSGLRVKLDEQRWVELNSFTNSGTKIGDRKMKVFWKPDGTLIDPPEDFNPLTLIPKPDTSGQSTRVDREVNLQVVAPTASKISIGSRGIGVFGNFRVPIDDDFVQFPVQYSVVPSQSHTYLEVEVSQQKVEKLELDDSRIHVLNNLKPHTLFILTPKASDFAWTLAMEQDGELVMVDPTMTGGSSSGKFSPIPQEAQAVLSEDFKNVQVIGVHFDKTKPRPKLLWIQRSRYDVVRFDNLSVFPRSKSAVKVSVNGVPVSEEDQLTFSDPQQTPPITVPTRQDGGKIEFIDLEGTVVDAKGKAIENCWVGMFVHSQETGQGETRSTFDPKMTLVTNVKTDAEGRFKMSAPNDHFVFQVSFWAMQEDGTSGALQLYRPGRHTRKNLIIKMADATAEVKVIDPEGNPVVGASITPEKVSKPGITKYEFPAEVRRQVTATTDENGIVRFRGWTTAGLRDVSVTTQDYGTQYCRNAHLNATAEQQFLLTLRTTASLTGKVLGFDPAADKGLKLQVRTEDWAGPKPNLGGRAIVSVADDGSFHVPRLMAGRVKLDSNVGPSSLRKIQFQRLPPLEQGENRKIANEELPKIVQGVRVRQQFVKKDSGELCPDVGLRVLWGGAVKGEGSWNTSKETRTNAEGWWEAIVLPGTINARGGFPQGYRGTAWFDGRNGYVGVEHIIPETDQVVTLPPERFVPAEKMTGRLLLPDGKPAAGWTAYGHPVSWNDVGVGGVTTDDQGEFTWSFPTGYPPRLFNVSNRQWLTEHKFTDDYAYPKVVSEDPLVLQIELPKEGSETVKP